MEGRREVPRVLFLCTGNACRSQMAEGWLRHLAGQRGLAVEVVSAGTRPHGVSPRAVAAMADAGVDISAHTSDPIEAWLDDPPDLVIAVCDQAAASCPSFPGRVASLAMPFRDPAPGGVAAAGDEAAIRADFADLCATIRERLAAWLDAGAAPLGLVHASGLPAGEASR